MTSMVAADVDGGGPVERLAGLVLVCYPLHPPGKPDRLRVERFEDLLGELDGPVDAIILDPPALVKGTGQPITEAA